MEIKADLYMASVNSIVLLAKQSGLTSFSSLWQIKDALNAGNYSRVREIYLQGKDAGINMIPFLSAKNFIIIANLSEDDYVGKNYQANTFYQSLVEKFGAERVIPICAKIEAELKHLEGFLTSVMKKLSNEKFVSSAPKAVVDMENKKKSDAETKIAKLNQLKEDLLK